MSGMLPGSSRNEEIGTPRGLYDRLHTAFAFTYDPFASHENALCDTYSTVYGTFSKQNLWRRDRLALTDEDGLQYNWRGQRVFMNPPYSRGMVGQCVEKAIAERNNAAIIVMLIKVDTSTKWFQRLQEHAFIEYLPKRLRYEGQAQGATFASCIAIMRKDWV